MSELFKNKYRIPSARLQTWDYASAALYFVTICTRNRECFFGDIQNHEMVLNQLGKTVKTEWEKTPAERPDMNLELFEFVVMPNHFHGIIMIGENEYNTRFRDARHRVSESGTQNRDARPGVSTNAPVNKFGPQRKNLGSIIRGFKSAVTIFALDNKIEFGWQERFHDHIIRNAEEYQKIANYIYDNPVNWGKDKFYVPHKTI